MMDNNAASYAELDEFLENMRRVETIQPEDTVAVVDALRSKTASNIAAQLDPYGHPWRPTKDGRPALQNAMQSIKIEADGTSIKFEVEGVEWRHHVGSARGYHGGSGAGYTKAGGEANLEMAGLGGFRRPLIPFSRIPGPFKAIIRTVLATRLGRVFRKAA